MKKLNKKILITGGAGYVGRNLLNFFIKKKYHICVIDNLSTSIAFDKNIKKDISFYKIDLAKENKVKSFFKKKNFDLIIHLAAFSGVKEFNKNTLKSFNNNVLATKNLVHFGFKNKKTKLIFSSSAAVYGKVPREKISETKFCRPANYYGLSKLACEHIINNGFKNKNNNYAILRYFNVVGSTVVYKISKKINSLFDIISKNIKEKKYKININGKKFNTKDGTPERDFIHIKDLCEIHEKTYKYLNKNKLVYSDFVKVGQEMAGKIIFNTTEVHPDVYRIFAEANTIMAFYTDLKLGEKTSTNYVNYLKKHIKNPINNKLEVVWNGGMSAIDQADFDWVTGSAMIGQSDETETIQITDDKRHIEREEYNGSTDWVSVRTKYFIAALLAENSADYATMTGYVENSGISPSYTVGLGYYNSDLINTSVYLGPLDIDHIGALNNTLDETINFGFQIVRPIGKFVLWFLKIIHNTLNLNYGICLIIFAAIIQLLTSPLTKKTYESSRKMQEINPLVKKVQEKYKDDPQKMNKEVMKLYTENGVNPLSGCLPLLLQMPLLMAIFSVFKDTIEFRGANFFLWINDLSQPDILFHLPDGWWIPLYGDHVAFLPILMGISIFLTQRLSMSTMDPAQKPMMYAMNGFFILIFNGFPAGLNLYYTVYNLLNYYQQKTIRSQNQ